MTTGVFFRIPTDNGFPALVNNIIPDWTNSRCFTFDSGGATVWKNSLTDGTLTSASTVGSILSSGGNVILVMASCLGGDGNLYSVTYNNATGYPTLVLSQIDPGAMTESDSTALTTASRSSPSALDFRICPITVDGTPYIAVFEVGYADSAVEVFRCSDMASMATGTTQTGPAGCSVTFGEEIDSTTSHFYLLSMSGTSTKVERFLFDTGSSGLSSDIVASFVNSGFDAGWSDAGYVHAGNISFDPADTTVVFCVRIVAGGGSSTAYVVKCDPSDGSLPWSVPVASGYSPTYTPTVAPCGADLSGGDLVYLDIDGTLTTITLSDGSYTVVTGDDHFGGMLTNTGAPRWASTQERLLFYSSGGTGGVDIDVDWPGGWALAGVFSQGPSGADPCLNYAGYYDADLPAAEDAVDATWPFDDLKPRHISIIPVHATLGGGQALTKNEAAEDSGLGFWKLTLGAIPVRTREQVLKWRALEALLNGRAGVCLTHIYDGKRAPWLIVGDPITAEAASDWGVGDTSGSILVTSGGELFEGMHFSVGERLYRLLTVAGPSVGVYTVTFWPKIRTAVLTGADVEFAHPVCRMRLVQDDGMKMSLDLLKTQNPTVEFVEDI